MYKFWYVKLLFEHRWLLMLIPNSSMEIKGNHNNIFLSFQNPPPIAGINIILIATGTGIQPSDEILYYSYLDKWLLNGPCPSCVTFGISPICKAPSGELYATETYIGCTFCGSLPPPTNNRIRHEEATKTCTKIQVSAIKIKTWDKSRPADGFFVDFSLWVRT